MKIRIFFLAFLLPCLLCAQSLPYQDKSLSAEKRAADLLGRLSLQEKAALVLYDSPAIPRLGIPAYNWWNEALHGVARNGAATTFPQPIGMAASFDDSLLFRVFSVVSDEGRVKNRLARQEGFEDKYCGITFWTPNINIFRDPRWGRGMETYGEDPYLTSRMGQAVVRGLQGPENSSVRKAHACAKHFAVHSGPESTRHAFDAEVSERDLRETYLPAFKDLVTKAGVAEVMTAYNRFRGIPCSANTYLTDTLLRGEWGFKGLIVSDCWALSDFYEEGRHAYTATPAEAAALAAKAGVDAECGETYRHVLEALEIGLLKEEDLDRNLLRVLKARFELGQIDGASPWDSLPDEIIESAEHRALALQMATESIVLLQNRGGVLPLGKDAQIVLVGPNADAVTMMWGNYNPIPSTTETLKSALEKRIPGMITVKGCGYVDGADMESVMKAVENADAVIFAGGISPALEGEEMPVAVPGFSGGDRTDIELPRVQRDLLKAIHETGKKLILVNFSGSAIGLVPESGTCDAILQAWYPGQEGGTAIANILFGESSPSGKLPVTFYKSASQLPPFDDYAMEGHTYRFFRGVALYEFGHGLTYTTFKYGRPRIRNGKLTIKLKNTGSVDGVETVQLYVSRKKDRNGPIKTLRDFARVEVPAGKSVKVSFPLDEECFDWWDENSRDMKPCSGRYKLYVGGSSAKRNLKARSFNFKARN